MVTHNDGCNGITYLPLQYSRSSCFSDLLSSFLFLEYSSHRRQNLVATAARSSNKEDKFESGIIHNQMCGLKLTTRL